MEGREGQGTPSPQFIMVRWIRSRLRPVCPLKKYVPCSSLHRAVPFGGPISLGPLDSQSLSGSTNRQWAGTLPKEPRGFCSLPPPSSGGGGVGSCFNSHESAPLSSLYPHPLKECGVPEKKKPERRALAIFLFGQLGVGMMKFRKTT